MAEVTPEPLPLDDVTAEGRPLIPGVIAVPLPPAIQSVIRHWITSNSDALDERLEPYGLTSRDVVMPDFEKVVRLDGAYSGKRS